MSKPPQEAGFYWVKTGSYKWFNGIAHVTGDAPYLQLTEVWMPADSKIAHSPGLYSVSEWGPKIEHPEAHR